MKHSIVRSTLVMGSTRALNMLMPIVDLAIVTNILFVAAGTLAISTQFIQIFVVISASIFVGLNILIPQKMDRQGTSEIYTSTVLLGLCLGVLFSLAASIGLLFYTPEKDALVAGLVLAIGLIPLFGYSAVFSFIESIGEENRVPKLGLVSNILNLTLGLLLLLLFDNPVFAVVVSTSLVRLYMFAHITVIASKLGFNVKSKIDTNFLMKVISYGIPEAASRIIFVVLMTSVVYLASTKLSTMDFSYLAVALNFMNFLFVVGMAITVALSVHHSNSQALFRKRDFTKDSLTLLVLFITFAAAIIPLFIIVNGQRTELYIILLLAFFAIAFDIMSMILVTFHRLNGISSWPPFIRLLLFASIFFGFSSNIVTSVHTLLAAFAVGNALVFTVLFFSSLYVSAYLGNTRALP